MTTASPTSVANFTTNAGYSTLAAELFTLIFTTLGLTQTADSGQMSGTPSLTLPTPANTSSGYWIGRFNDSNQTAAPVYFKLEIGCGAATTDFQIWITVGTGSNGSGTITGTGAGVMTRVECCSNTAFTSSITTYITRGCYNATDGVFWILYKQASGAQVNGSMGGFHIYRDVNNAGVAQANSVHLLTNGSSAVNGSTTSSGEIQVMSFLSATVYNTAPFPTPNWGTFPLALTTTTISGNDYGGPLWQYTPVPGISAWGQIQLLSEVPLGTTVSLTIVGSNPHTYIQAGVFFASSGNLTNLGLSINTYGMLLPWE